MYDKNQERLNDEQLNREGIYERRSKSCKNLLLQNIFYNSFLSGWRKVLEPLRKNIQTLDITTNKEIVDNVIGEFFVVKNFLKSNL